jgi:hypothetical protein
VIGLAKKWGVPLGFSFDPVLVWWEPFVRNAVLYLMIVFLVMGLILSVISPWATVLRYATVCFTRCDRLVNPEPVDFFFPSKVTSLGFVIGDVVLVTHKPFNYGPQDTLVVRDGLFGRAAVSVSNMTSPDASKIWVWNYRVSDRWPDDGPVLIDKESIVAKVTDGPIPFVAWIVLIVVAAYTALLCIIAAMVEITLVETELLAKEQLHAKQS